ncbi:MAG: DUF899 family protein [Candidatus Eremiobacteraeota bacterium]|nr:DUF899 family protein [Candidatus Eremiobacteraeota bacterium]
MMTEVVINMPGATSDYTDARKKLDAAEVELRDHVGRVAALRRALPEGPEVKDYVFLDGDREVRLSELFANGKPYLMMYHLMYWQDDKEFCPMCSMWVDGLDAVAQHIEQNANIVVASFAPVPALRDWKMLRGWRRLRVLSDKDAWFAKDTGAEDSKGDPQPTILVFAKKPSGIHHVYTGHAAMSDGGLRGIDLLSPTWHVLDLLPVGRGDFNASNDYVTTP